MPETAGVPDRPEIGEPELASLFERCSNVGRWGPDDELGTLNLITPAVRAAAARLVVEGLSIALGRDLHAVGSGERAPVRHRMIDASPDPWALDAIEIAPHGYQVTHLDALGHVFIDGWAWNGRAVASILTAEGLRFASIRGSREGIFTRGVLLDVPAARGVPWLGEADVVTPDDLDRAEALAGVEVGPGDAIVVRVGLQAREAIEGPEDPSRRAGLNAACLEWIHRRDVAVYAGDCVEQRPSPYPGLSVAVPHDRHGRDGAGVPR